MDPRPVKHSYLPRQLMNHLDAWVSAPAIKSSAIGTQSVGLPIGNGIRHMSEWHSLAAFTPTCSYHSRAEIMDPNITDVSLRTYW